MELVGQSLMGQPVTSSQTPLCFDRQALDPAGLSAERDAEGEMFAAGAEDEIRQSTLTTLDEAPLATAVQ
jgi:hypothetical protein